MFKIVSSVCAAAMMLTLPLTTPGFAMPKAAPSWVEQGATQVQLRERGEWRGGGDRNWRGGDRNWRGGDRNWRGNRNWQAQRPPHASPGGGWERRGDSYYMRGHRGYRHHRPGYRQYNGWWFPPAAFIAGAIIGGGMAQPPVQYRPRGNAHVDWCYNRYRSYRASDNTFQPYNGPRRQCVSPYG